MIRYARVGEANVDVVRVERRLAAVLTADVVGYRRLMEPDEAGTLKARRKGVLEPLVATHRGP